MPLSLEGASQPATMLHECGPPSPTPPPPPQEPSRQASSDDMSEDRPEEEDLEVEDEKAQEQEYLARKRHAEVVHEALKGVGWLSELASAGYDGVMNGAFEDEQEAKEDESEEAQEARAGERARFMSACDMLYDKQVLAPDRLFERE